MIVIVYNVKMTVGDVQVDLKFYHSVCVPSKGRFRFVPLRRKLASVKVKRLDVVGKRFGKDFDKSSGKRSRRCVRPPPPLEKLKAADWAAICSRNSRKKYRQLTTVSSSLPLEDVQRHNHNHDTPPDSPIIQKLEGIVNGYDEGSVNAGWGPQQLAVWLQANRYGPHIHTLATYSGADLLRLSRDNLVQLCGLPDGIRLYNVLHAKPKLTLYICVDSNERVYQAIYMTCLTSNELVGKVSGAIGLHVSQVASMYVEGPNGIKLVLNDQLVSHLNDHSAYSISNVLDGERYQLLLKQSEHNPSP